ncbi:hypothetical protein MMC31_006879 [Peltigera leucophlebia]|nr:hypothetical protein [Peltigera leucophlebia]
MARENRKLSAGDPKLSKTTPQKCARPAVPSKRPVIIGTLSPSVVHLGAFPQQHIPNSPASKHKSKATPIIVEVAVNNPWQNVRQVNQIEDSPSSSEDEVRHQGPEVNTSDLLLELATEQVAIGQYYAQLELDEQTEFHVDNMEKEIERLHTLVEIELQKVASMEQDIVFLRSKEVERKNPIWFLQEVWLSGRQIEEEIRGIKSWLKEPIYAQAKRGLTDEERA